MRGRISDCERPLQKAHTSPPPLLSLANWTTSRGANGATFQDQQTERIRPSAGPRVQPDASRESTHVRGPVANLTRRIEHARGSDKYFRVSHALPAAP